MVNPNSSAFPYESRDESVSEAGLTKREYLAAQILCGISAGSNRTDNDWLVSRAVKLADLLIEELNKPVL